MGKVIGVPNHKGGVGKTEMMGSLGVALRLRGFRVLLVDLDGQANLTDELVVEMFENKVF
jgi:chromosome partitioning protein